MKAKLAICPFLSFVPLVFLACPLFFLLLLPSMFYCLSLPHFVTLLLLFSFSRVFFLLPLSVFSFCGLLCLVCLFFLLPFLLCRHHLLWSLFISKSVDVVNNSHFTYRPIVFCRKVKTFNQKQLFGLVDCI